MTKAILKQDLYNTVLDQDVLVGKTGDTVTVLEDHGGYYTVINYSGPNPSMSFYASTEQLSIIHD